MKFPIAGRIEVGNDRISGSPKYRTGVSVRTLRIRLEGLTKVHDSGAIRQPEHLFVAALAFPRSSSLAVALTQREPILNFVCQTELFTRL